jgi:peroxiredoxin
VSGALPPGLPAPVDDGAADHLLGSEIPSLTLAATTGAGVDLASAAVATLVLYVYPRTGPAGAAPSPEWDAVPGARGCTPQSCAFRDLHAELRALGASVLGLSAQPLEEQREFAERVHLPYPLLSDPDLRLAAALDLPVFEFEGTRLYKRITLIVRSGRVAKTFYPVFPPDRNAAEVSAWLAQERP